MRLGGDEGRRRRRQEQGAGGQLLRGRPRELAPELQHFTCSGQWVDDEPAENDPGLVDVEFEGGHDPEVAAAPAEAPEQVAVLGRARVDELAVRRHDVRRAQVVAGEAVLPHEPAEAAAQRQPRNSRRRDVASGGREATSRRREFLS